MRLNRAMIISVLSLLIFAACTPSQDKAIEEMLSTEEGAYTFYLFWDGTKDDYTTVTMDMLEILNSEELLPVINLENFTPISVHDQNQPYPYREVFAIEETPYLIVVDDKDLVLETHQLDDVYQLVD